MFSFIGSCSVIGSHWLPPKEHGSLGPDPIWQPARHFSHSSSSHGQKDVQQHKPYLDCMHLNLIHPHLCSAIALAILVHQGKLTANFLWRYPFTQSKESNALLTCAKTHSIHDDEAEKGCQRLGFSMKKPRIQVLYLAKLFCRFWILFPNPSVDWLPLTYTQQAA